MAVSVERSWPGDSTGGILARVQDYLGVDEGTGGDSLIQGLVKSGGSRLAREIPDCILIFFKEQPRLETIVAWVGFVVTGRGRHDGVTEERGEAAVGMRVGYLRPEARSLSERYQQIDERKGRQTA